MVQQPACVDSARAGELLLEARRNSLHELELAARCQTCDWGFGQREESVYLVINEIQQMRSLVYLVSLRARIAIIDGRVDAAVHWIQIDFLHGPARERRPALGPVPDWGLLEPGDVPDSRGPDPGAVRPAGPGPLRGGRDPSSIFLPD